jgi:NAD(P)-dependent dehydrogenase (short-subunit alcohol dehydrogenase family)
VDITDFSMDFFSLEGKNAVVTGGNTGLGRAFSLALAKAGANLFIPGIIEDTEIETLIISEGVQAESLHADLTEKGTPKKIIDSCVERFGSVDILVNNAGLCINTPVEEFDREPWDKMVDINLTGAFEMTYEASKQMIPRRKGKIINICSLFSYLGGQWSPAYAATKHGLTGLTKAYCDELAQYNIQVNGIAPGYFATELTTKTRTTPETSTKVLNHVPAGKWGDTVDLMGTTVFLASDASNFVNGHVLVVDGGYLVR